MHDWARTHDSLAVDAPMKILCLQDEKMKPGDRWLWKYLPGNNDELDFVGTTGPRTVFNTGSSA